MMNWYVGWSLLLTVFVTGVTIGLYFHRDDFLGGYASFRRRILRLGHIALAALGMVNVLFGLTPVASGSSLQYQIAAWGFVVGGVTMPLVCFLTSWRAAF